MRLKSEMWAKAYVRRCAGAGLGAYIVRHGDDDAGAIYVKVNRLDGTCVLYGPAPAGLDSAASDRRFTVCFDGAPQPEATADAFIRREAEFDPDVWVVEIEDRAGRHFLDGWLVD